VTSELIHCHCWLLNTSGWEGKFIPGDLFQEFNNAAIKVRCFITYLCALYLNVWNFLKHVHAPMGVNANWQLINELTPAVPFYKRIVELVEKSFDLKHSTKHTLPNPEEDVAGLMRTYRNGRIFEYREGRKDHSTKETSPKDALKLGSCAMQDTRYLNELFEEWWMYLSNAKGCEDYTLPPMTSSLPPKVNNDSLLSEEIIENGDSSPLQVFPDNFDENFDIENTSHFDSSLFIDNNILATLSLDF
jgi:hypothetical protein